MNIKSRKLKTLVTPIQFSKIKRVHRSTVYDHVSSGKIEVTLIGQEEDVFIDLKDYQDYEFDRSRDNTQKRKLS